jgi:HPt (histidine-containing phosphotransfer) domain-containing protein
MMIDPKRVPAEVLAELKREFAAGLPGRIALMRAALDDIETGAAVEGATRLRLTAHSLVGTAATFGATELTPHAERLESLGREWQERAVNARQLAAARRTLDDLARAVERAAARLAR